jgi:hypothetical protein
MFRIEKGTKLSVHILQKRHEREEGEGGLTITEWEIEEVD